MRTPAASRPGRPASDPADIEARRQTYIRLKAELGMTAKEIAGFVGLSAGTVGTYPHRLIPTWRTLQLMQKRVLHESLVAVVTARERMHAADEALARIEARTAI